MASWEVVTGTVLTGPASNGAAVGVGVFIWGFSVAVLAFRGERRAFEEEVI